MTTKRKTQAKQLKWLDEINRVIKFHAEYFGKSSLKDIPQEFWTELEDHMFNLVNIQNMIWQAEADNKQPLSFNAENISGVSELSIDAAPQTFEFKLIEYMHHVGVLYYGQPVYTYADLENTIAGYGAADYWINLTKVGRMRSPGMNKRRFESFMLSINDQTEISELQKQAWDKFSETAMTLLTQDHGIEHWWYMLDEGEKSTHKKGSEFFALNHSNVGFPFYMKDNSIDKDGEKISAKVDKLANLLDVYKIYLGHIPAQPLGRDQMSGIKVNEDGSPVYDIQLQNGVYVIVDKDRFKKYEDLYKYHKGRKVWGLSRAVVEKDVIGEPIVTNWQAHNPVLIGWNNKDYLRQSMKKRAKAAEKLGYILVNVDWSGFDEGITPEEQAASMVLLNHWRRNNIPGMTRQQTDDYVLRTIVPMLKQAIVLPKDGIDESGLSLPVKDIKTWDDLLKFVDYLYSNGSITSGAKSTQAMGVVVHLLRMTTALIELYPDYTSMYSRFKRETQGEAANVYLSDDGNLLLKSYDDIKKLDEILVRRYGGGIYNIKMAYGAFFLQQRIYPNVSEGNDDYSSPSSRYVWRWFFKETEAKARAGRVSAIVANWQIAGEFMLGGNPERWEYLAFLVYTDKYGAGIKWDSNYIREKLAEEALKILGKEDSKPSDLLYNGDPLNIDRWDDDGNLNVDYINQVLKNLRLAWSKFKKGEIGLFTSYFDKAFEE